MKPSFVLATLVIPALATAQPNFPAPSNTRFQGFVDAQASWTSPSALNTGFALNDAAFYLTHTVGSHSLHIDIPFQGTAHSDHEGPTLVLPTEKAQAYLKLGLGENASLMAGQFDAPFGFESADTAENFFNAGGIVANFVPGTLVGANAEVALGDLSLQLMVANPYNASRLLGRNPDAGAVLGYGGDESPFTASVGLLVSDTDLVDTRALLNVLFGLKAGKGAFDVEADFITADEWGVLAQYVHQCTDMWSFGVKGEYAKFKTDVDQWQTSVGANAQLNESVKIKADYTLLPEDIEAANTDTAHQVAISAIYSF
jgi:hypothetical protein